MNPPLPPPPPPSNVHGFRAVLTCGCTIDLHHEVVIGAHVHCPDGHRVHQRVALERIPNRSEAQLRQWQPSPPPPRAQQTSPAIAAGAVKQAGTESGETTYVPTQPAHYYMQRVAEALAATTQRLAEMWAFFAHPQNGGVPCPPGGGGPVAA